MKTLAIKGHSTRGREVIQILEMLGGINKYRVSITKSNYELLYTMREDDNVIIGTYPIGTISPVYTLEQFLKKFPYKVGDKVQEKGFKSDNPVYTVERMRWENDHVVYVISSNGFKMTTIAEYLQPYKEDDNMNQENKIEITEINLNHPCFDEYNKVELIIPNNWEFKQKDGKMFGIRKQYPKTYGECSDILHTSCSRISIPGYREYQIALFQELLICRDAYWKIAGDWEEKRKKEINHYVIYFTLNGGLVKDCLPCTMVKHLLDFPTEKMRDVFFENFKNLIEKCKEFL